MVRLLMEHMCEKFIVERLRFGLFDDGEIDRIWRNLHDYAVGLLVERLKNELSARGFPISILGEAENPTGRYDVLLLVDRKGVKLLNSSGSICLEGKTGLNISLTQLEKYMWNGAIVVLVRFATGDIILLRASKWAEFIKLALTIRIEKARRILEGKIILVPGIDCRECPSKECKFNKNGPEKREMTKPRDIAELFENFRRNAPRAIEFAVRAVWGSFA